jgi:hypothetical protein
MFEKNVANEYNSIYLKHLSKEIQEKLKQITTELLNFKQTNNLTNINIIESTKMIHLLYELELIIRQGKEQPKTEKMHKIRDLCLGYLTEIFKLKKDYFSVKYNQIFNKIHLENVQIKLKAKIQELSSDVSNSMPNNYLKYSKAINEYNRNKNQQADDKNKKQNLPRKRFEMTEKIRETIVDIIRYKIYLYKMSKNSNLSNHSDDPDDRLEFFQNFFETELINIWPKNWMQKNVLLNIYQTRFCQQIIQKNQSINNM